MYVNGKRPTIFRRLTVVAVAFLLAQVGVVALPSLATAEVSPSSWSVAVTDIPRPATMLTTPDGGLSIGCSAAGATTVKSFDGSGTVTQSIGGSGASWPDMCVPHSAVGKDGTVYTYADVNNFHGSALVAYKDGNVVWSYSPPCSGGVNAIAMGTNGNVYFVATGWGACPALSVIGLTPAAISGTTTPQVVLNQAIANDFVQGGLSAYAGGVVVRGVNSIQYVTYSGNVTSVAVGMSYLYGPFNVGTDSTVALPIKPGSAAVSNCLNTYSGWGSDNLAGALAVYAAGSLQWSHDLPDCAKVYEVQPTPSGGVVAHVRVPRLGAAALDYLLAIGSGDTALWSHDVSLQPGETSQNIAFTADLNGNVAMQRNVWLAGTGSGSGYQFPAVSFELLDGTTGIELASVDLSADASASSGPSYLSTDMSQVVIAHNRLYVSAHSCTNMQGCNWSSSTLYAFPVPGLQMDYPRGAVLEYDKPWLNYVAMGDSFSSGEGVPEFLAGTDIDGPPKNVCHRSEKAYAKLLDNMPGPRLHLTTFVACSGAETRHITGTWTQADGKNTNEPAQVDALSEATDIVTVTIGGNDIGFSKFVGECLFADCTAVLQGYLNKVAALGAALDSAYNAILAHAPNATVYVMGYPELLPASGSDCSYTSGGQVVVAWLASIGSAISQASEPQARVFLSFLGFTSEQVNLIIANGGRVEFTAAEQDAAHTLVTALDTKIKATIGTIRPHLRYVDPLTLGSTFSGHQLCSTGEYFFGVRIDRPEFSFHPKDRGQGAYMQLLMKNL